MATLIALLEGAFRWMLEASLYAGLLAGLVGLVLALARDRIAPRWRHALWLLVALRLCLPAAPPSPFGFARLLPGPSDRPAPGDWVIIRPGADSPFAPRASAATPARAGTATVARAGSTANPGWTTLLALAWLLGAGFFALRLALASARERRALRGLVPVTRPAALAVFAGCARALRLRRPPGLLAGPGVAAPCLAGLFRPRVLLPPAFVKDASIEELRQVLLHELAHVKRRDVASSWLLASLETLHWFNPVVCWAFARAREERELACDAVVLGRSGGDGRAYAATLVRVLEASALAPGPLPAIGLGGARAAERRIRWLIEGRHRRGSRLLAAMALAICAALGLTDCRGPPARESFETKVYDLGSLLETPQDFRAPRLGVRAHIDEDPSPERGDPEALRAERRKKSEDIAARIKDRALPETWTEGGAIEIGEEQLTVTAPPAVHDAVREILARKMVEKDIMVSAQFKVLSLDAATLDRAPPRIAEALRAVAADAKASRAGLPAAEVEVLLGLRRADGSSPVRASPAVTASNRQLVFARVMKQYPPLIADLKKTERDGRTVFDPEFEILNRGHTIQIRAEVDEDRQAVGFDLTFEWVDVAEPIASAIVEGIPIAMPEVSMMHKLAEFTASPGTWVVATADRVRVPPKSRAGDDSKPAWTEETLVLLVKAEVHRKADVERR